MTDSTSEIQRRIIESYADDLSEIRRDIHKHPEMAYEKTGPLILLRGF